MASETEIAAHVILIAEQRPWLPINREAALFKFAQHNALGFPQTDEFSFLFDGKSYIAQVFERGYVYAVLGEWDNCKWMSK